MYLAFGEAGAAVVPFAFPVLIALNLGVFMVKGWYSLFHIGQLLLILVLPFILMLALGGFVSSSAVIFWCMLSPLGALVYTGRREATFWFLAFVGILALGGVLDPIVESSNSIPSEWKIVLFVLNVLGPSALAFLILGYFVHQLETEQQKSEGLLLNVLPAEVAAVLKNGARSVPERSENVSVLFADLVGSTTLAATLPPDALVNLLNTFFSHFDSLTERYGVEKISTSGDNYMVAAGVLKPRADHAQALAAMALDMQDYLKSGTGENNEVQFRIGINSGAAVAGVIGQKKFHYDLWGDAVNRASRMESYGEPGRI
jgi:guanylate cyclase